jgi:hypothetical protein
MINSALKGISIIIARVIFGYFNPEKEELYEKEKDYRAEAWSSTLSR